MLTPKQEKTTQLTELVETHNIALSLKRIRSAPGYDDARWRRALYHALAMSYVASNSELEQIRVAIKIP